MQENTNIKKFFAVLVLLTIVISLYTACNCGTSNPNVPVTTFSPSKIPLPTAPPSDQSQNPPALGSSKPEEYVRNITVDDRNNVFSIGVPAYQFEKTEVTAESPVDFWFEYFPQEMQLQVNGQAVERDPTGWELKLGYTRGVTDFNYKAINPAANTLAYNLHITPSDPTAKIPVTVKQTWQPISSNN